jgi:hypothetical protein
VAQVVESPHIKCEALYLSPSTAKHLLQIIKKRPTLDWYCGLTNKVPA